MESNFCYPLYQLCLEKEGCKFFASKSSFCHILNRKFNWVLNKRTKAKWLWKTCKEEDSLSKVCKKLCKPHDSLSSPMKATSRWADSSHANVSQPPSSYGCRSSGIRDLKSSLLTSFPSFFPPCWGLQGGTLWDHVSIGKGSSFKLRPELGGRCQFWFSFFLMWGIFIKHIFHKVKYHFKQGLFY